MIQENITLDRRLLELKIGTVVWWKGNEYQISDILSFSEVVATHLETYKSSIIPI